MQSNKHFGSFKCHLKKMLIDLENHCFTDYPVSRVQFRTSLIFMNTSFS